MIFSKRAWKVICSYFGGYVYYIGTTTWYYDQLHTIMTLCKHRMVLPDKRPAVSTWSQRFACRPTSRPSLPEFLNKCSVHPFLPTPSLCFNTVDGDWNSKTTAFGLLMTGTLTLSILFLLKFFMKQTDGALKQDSWSHSHSWEEVQLFETRLRFISTRGALKLPTTYDNRPSKQSHPICPSIPI